MLFRQDSFTCIRSSSCPFKLDTNALVVCFQETKMALIYSFSVLEVLGPEFDDYDYLPADGTRVSC
jgi:hypothetical protein